MGVNSMNVTLLAVVPCQERPLISKNDVVVYSARGRVGEEEVEGAVVVRVVAVRRVKFLVDVVPSNVPSMKRARLTFPWDGEELADLGGIVAGWSVLHHGERKGRTTISTPFGEREAEHYVRVEEKENGTLRSEQFVEPVHHLPYMARMSGKSGDVTFGMVETSLRWVRGEG